jgi:exo-beta-1,3-glucanase (GH17 family)
VLSERVTNRWIALAACIVLAAVLSGTMAAAPAAASTSQVNRWYLAEGYTGTGFQEYLCIANPGSSAASVTADFLFKGGGSTTKSFTVKGASRFTVDVNGAVGQGREVSTVISSTCADLVIERPMYFAYQGVWKGGHTVRATASPSMQWYFAEGYTGSGFDEYVCVMNPNDQSACLRFSFQTASSGQVIRSGTVPAHSRSTFKVNDLLGQGLESSLSLASDVPVVAERPMYFEYTSSSGARWRGGDCVMGSPGLSTRWYFAEGTTRQGFDEWLTLQNPSSAAITVNATYQLGQGQGGPVTRAYAVGPRQRRTVDVPAETGRQKDVSVLLTSPAEFLAERPVYYGYEHSGLWLEGAQCAMGSCSCQSAQFFAEGYTGQFFEEWLCIQNTSAAPAAIAIDYLTQELGALPTRTISVAPLSRQTVFVNQSAGPDYQLATRVRVLSGSGVVVERPMYFDSTRWQLPCVGQPVDNSLYGICFSPYLNTDPASGGSIPTQQIQSLIGTVARYSLWIRTFGSEGEWALMPAIARSNGMKVAGGCDIYTDLTRNASETASLLKQAQGRQVDMAVVGDEVLLSNALGEDQLIGYIRQVRAGGVPTTTSDGWNEWLEHPRLFAEVDVVLMNIYPYWEGVPLDQAVSYVASVWQQVNAAAGGRQVIIETGWPSSGETKGGAVASAANEARYLREFQAWARSAGAGYFFFEAFDEPWKVSREGACGGSWGLWGQSGALKADVAGVLTPRR